MKFKLIEAHPRTYVLVFQTDDELASGLKAFATQEQMSDASFKAIGALSAVRLAWLNPNTKKYETCVDLKEQVELLSLIGDIAEFEGKPVVHAHVIVGKHDGTTRGGHLLEAVIHPTCEVFLTEAPVHLRKTPDPEFGIPLIAL